jgi:hypothetical protein
MIRIRLLVLTAAVLLSPSFSLAQQTRPDDKAGDTALKAKAYELLESLATQISTLQSAENRARISSNIAWSLWPHDEKRARTLFVEAGQDIRSGLQPPERNDPQNEHTLMVFLQLRTDTINRIAKYDPEFAFDFFKTTEPSYEELPRAAREKERALALQLAKQVAGANPDLALKLGRSSLAHGPSEEVLTLIRQLLRKHREQGVALYKEAVGTLRKTKITGDYRQINFVLGLAQITPPLSDETAFRELIDTLMTASLAYKCDKEVWDEDSGFFCGEVGPLLARMGAVDSRAAKLKHLGSESESRSWATEAYAELEELAEARDFDGLFRLTEKYPPIKNTILWRAFDLARNAGELERARKIAAAYDFSPEAQQRMLEQIERIKEAATLSEAEVDEIQRKSAAIADPEKRANYLVDSAMQIGANNRTVALKLLDRATEIIESHKPGTVRTRALISVAALYSMEKSDRGFTIMEAQLPQLNELIDAAIKLDGFDTQYVRDGEWNMSANGNLGELLTHLSQNAPYFAWCDFDRAVTMAAQFDRAEIRIMAQLKLAQGILAGPPKRPRVN